MPTEVTSKFDGSLEYTEYGWPSELCRLQSHSHYELRFIAATTGKAFVGNYIGTFEMGALYLLGPHLPHNWITDEISHPSSFPLRDMVLRFSPEGLKRLAEAFPEFHELDVLLDRAKCGIEFLDFDQTAAQAHMIGIRDANGAGRIVRFFAFLLALNAHPKQKQLSQRPVDEPSTRRVTSQIEKAIDHISQNFAEDIMLDDVADMAGLSPSTFSRRFKQTMGMGFVAFVTKVRIEHACRLLKQTDDSIFTICFEAGFRNVANFNRQFLKAKGMTPSKFRQAM